MKDLTAIFAKLHANLTMKLKKSHFFKQQLTFLRHIVCEKGVKMDRDKIETMINFPHSQDIKSLQRFLGPGRAVSQVYSQFADFAVPLN